MQFHDLHLGIDDSNQRSAVLSQTLGTRRAASNTTNAKCGLNYWLRFFVSAAHWSRKNPSWWAFHCCHYGQQFAHRTVLFFVVGNLGRRTRGFAIRLGTRATAATATALFNGVADPEQSMQRISRTVKREKAQERR